ncbi:hypothetical protein BaRGS_00040406 [Batillaria attramentaria]|uniref:L-Fucosyltransferase n=1 Tax=Batillaria attramentaria TaxID=370345 RepID=A0ABD0J084_9CAEN
MTCGHRVQLKCFLAGLVIATTMMCLELLLSHHRTDSSNVPNFNIDAMSSAYHATREQNHSAMDITTELPRTSVLCHSFTARLGNIMFQYASCLALAKHLNASLVLLNDWRLQGLLQQPHATDSALKQRCQKARKIRARWCCAFDKRLLNLSPGRDYFLTGFLQSWKYFVKYDSEIRQALTFRDEVVATATKIVQSLRNAHRGVLVGVHVRRGDYTRSDRVKQGYKMAPVVTF